MQNRVWKIACKKIASLGRDDNGAVLVITLAVFFFLFMLVSGVYAIGEAVHRRIELQQICDAAAYSAAVVQADGLSRMATVNRAMAWTYVQMVKRQMDYITYRWLKLTTKQFKEDRKAAKDWHWYFLPCDEHHNEEGTGWWCGQGCGSGMDKIRLNYRMTVKVDDINKALDKVKSTMGDDDGGYSSGGGGYWEDAGIQPATGDGGLFGDANSLFGVGTDNPYKNEASQRVTEMTQAGQYVGPAEIEQIYKDMFTRTNPEPEKYVTGPNGEQQLNNAWIIWDAKFKNFTEANKLTNSDYCCQICGKPIQGYDHTKCINNQLNNLASGGSGSSGSSSSSSSSGSSGLSSKYNWGSKMAEQIKNDKKCLETLNLALDAININMTMAIKAAAEHVLEYNVPLGLDGEISDDFLYTIHIPTGSNPYNAAASGDASLAGIFSPVYNTEEYETLFLNMMDGDVHDNLIEYFTGTKSAGFLDAFFGGKLKAGGLDQWFIRTYPDETKKSNELKISPTDQSYYAEGISRSYKNANREEGKCLTGQLRANHVLSIGDNTDVGGGDDMFGIMNIFSSILDSLKQTIDFSPSCINRRGRFPEMCSKVKDSVGLVSQYRWCSAKWFCFFTVYLFGIEWHHPFFPKFYCSDHGYGTIWIGDEFDALWSGKNRNDYRNCFMGFDDTFILKGHARIYGDDRDLVDEQYVGTPARPWLLNEKFFAGDGTITVGLARRQRNPWQKFMAVLAAYNPKSDNLSSGLMSLFNVKEGNYLWTASTARAAYRRRTDGLISSTSQESSSNYDYLNAIASVQTWKLGGGSKDETTTVETWHSQHPTGYDMKFDVSAWPDALKIDYGPGASGDMKKLRVGCVCKDRDNQERLKQAWNLGTPDWDATLLPVRYSKGHLAKYESWKGEGCAWPGANGEGAGIFNLLAGLNWNGLGEHASESVPGRAIMQTINQEGKGLGSLDELEKLKIY